MTDVHDETRERRSGWTLTRDSLRRLLHWLDGGADSDGQSYVDIRRRLRDYFARKDCRNPEDLADETLSRVARRLEEENITVTEAPARYCYIVARFVFLEHRRELESSRTVARDPDAIAAAAGDAAAEAARAREDRLTCLERCLADLDPLNSRIITRYYVGAARVKIDNRRELADSLGLTPNALAIRASRIRKRLEACVRHCHGARRQDSDPGTLR